MINLMQVISFLCRHDGTLSFEHRDDDSVVVKMFVRQQSGDFIQHQQLISADQLNDERLKEQVLRISDYIAADIGEA